MHLIYTVFRLYSFEGTLMMATNRFRARIVFVLGLALLSAGAAHARGVIGNTLPASFPVIEDASLGVPVIGFGSQGSATRTPVIFLHGNGGTPYDTNCGVWRTRIQSMAQYFAEPVTPPVSCGH